MTLHIYFLVYLAQVEYKRHEAWIIVSTLIEKKTNHGIVKKLVFFKRNAGWVLNPPACPIYLQSLFLCHAFHTYYR